MPLNWRSNRLSFASAMPWFMDANKQARPKSLINQYSKNYKLHIVPPTKSGGDIRMVSVCPCIRPCVRPSVHPGFLTIIWKSNHSINFKFIACICWVSVQNWLTFGWHWPNVGPLVAKKGWKWVQMVVSDHYQKKYSYNPIQTCGVHLLGKCSGMICFGAMLAAFWPPRGHKMT